MHEPVVRQKVLQHVRAFAQRRPDREDDREQFSGGGDEALHPHLIIQAEVVGRHSVLHVLRDYGRLRGPARVCRHLGLHVDEPDIDIVIEKDEKISSALEYSKYCIMFLNGKNVNDQKLFDFFSPLDKT